MGDEDRKPTEVELLAEVVDLLADIHTWVKWHFRIVVVVVVLALASAWLGPMVR